MNVIPCYSQDGKTILQLEKKSKTEIKVSTRHHAKGVGFTKMNEQFDKLRQKVSHVAPNLDESYYEYSRHNPKRHR